jgi:hypothetical protein
MGMLSRAPSQEPPQNTFDQKDSGISPRAFAKPTKLETYYGVADPDEQVEHLDTILDYHRVRAAVKCKLFVLTLKDAAN